MEQRVRDLLKISAWVGAERECSAWRLDRVDNLVSIVLAIGSPALAGYSLAMTRLNSRWLSRQFLYLNFPNKNNIPLAVSALQHIPFKIDTSSSLLPSLIVLPQNDKYWEGLAKAAKRTRQWSIPVAMNILWVLVAFLLTIVDSFVDFDHFITVPGDAGYSIAAVWTWLLPLVVGWFHVGSQPDSDHLRSALDDAHESAYVATALEPALATQVTGRSTRAIKPSARHIDHVNADEKKTAPIFNYSRVFIWSQNAEHILRLYENATAKADRKIPVRCGENWTSNDDSTIRADDRTGNEAEVVLYCTDELPDTVGHGPIDSTLKLPTPQHPTPPTLYSASPPSRKSPTTTFSTASTAEVYTNASAFVHRRFPSTMSSNYDEEAPSVELRTTPGKPLFATEVFHRVFFAVVLTLVLQWGTTGAAILIHLKTPPEGMGCRALTFTIYGAASTAAFLLLLLSSILAHLARRQRLREKRSGSKKLVGYIAMFTRWLGKLIAIANGFGILLSCTMQFAGAYDNCFCSSSIFWGDPNGLVSFVEDDVKGSEVYNVWISGITTAFGVSGLYTFAIYVATPMG